MEKANNPFSVCLACLDLFEEVNIGIFPLLINRKPAQVNTVCLLYDYLLGCDKGFENVVV